MPLQLRNYKLLPFLWPGFLIAFDVNASAAPIIPTGNNNNALYYKIGGASDYALSPVQDTAVINLAVGANLGLSHQCGMFNPAGSIQNTLNHLYNNIAECSGFVVYRKIF